MASSAAKRSSPPKRRAPSNASRRRQAEPDPSTRDRILEVALGAFAELGFDGASTRAISARAGVNQGLIPYYFGNKEKLWREAVDRAFAELGAALAPVQDEVVDPRERLANMIRRYVRYVSVHPEFVKLMEEEGRRESPRMRWLVDRHIRPIYESTVKILEGAGATRFAGGDPLHIFYIFAGAAGILFHQAPECRRLTGRDPSDESVASAHAEALVSLFLGDSVGRTNP